MRRKYVVARDYEMNKKVELGLIESSWGLAHRAGRGREVEGGGKGGVAGA